MKWIQVEETPELVRIRFNLERLDSRVAEDVRAEITTAMPRDHRPLELDLSRVDFADSMGIGVLLIACKLLPPDAPRVRLIGCRPQLRQVLDLVNLAHLCDILPSS